MQFKQIFAKVLILNLGNKFATNIQVTKQTFKFIGYQLDC